MTPEQIEDRTLTPQDERLERCIQVKCAAVSSLYTRSRVAAGQGCHAAADDLRSQARQAAADVARLVAMRSPAVVALLERERGL